MRRSTSAKRLAHVKFHLALQIQNESFDESTSVHVNSRDDQIESRNPHSGLYTFMMEVSGYSIDLDAMNYFLRICPQNLANVIDTG